MDQNRQDDAPISAIDRTEKSLVDPETVEKAIRGDEKAFTALFTQTYRSMFFVVRRFLPKDEDIYDALQNGYIKAYKYLPRLRAPEAFIPWLKTTMENEARNIRDSIQSTELPCENMSSFLSDSESDSPESVERRADIEEVLSRLDPRQAQVLTLHYYDGMKLSKIAKMLNEPQSTVRSRFSKAKKALAEQLRSFKGIDKSMYSGSLSTMIAVCLRSLIGTDVLSAAVAQKMLDDILRGRPSKLGGAAYKILEKQRNRAILRAVSLLMVLTVVVSCITAALLNGLRWKQLHSPSSTADGAFEDTSAPEHIPTDAAGPDSSDKTMPVEAEPEPGKPDPTAPAPSGILSYPSGSTAFGPGTESTPIPRPDTSDTTASRPGTSNTTASKPESADTTSAEPDFLPDYAPGQANKVGNNPNNVGANRGFVAKQADWLYFTEGNGYRILMKMKTDGSQKQLIAEDANGFSYLNVVGDWIYYCGNGIWRIRTDGSQRELISSLNAKCLYVDGETGFFTFFAVDNPPIYRINLSTKKTILLQSRTSNNAITVGNGKILYIEQNILKILDIKTTRVYSTGQNCGVWSDILVSGNTVFYVSGGTVYSGDYTSEVFSPVKIGQISGAQLQPFYISPYKGGILGFWTSDSGIGTPSLLSLSGQAIDWPSSKPIYPSYNFYTFDDSYLYFYTEDLTLHRARGDGTNATSFS